MSSTQAHPDSYINARLAEFGSSTIPHPESYLQARIASIEAQQDIEESQDISLSGSVISSLDAPELPVPIQNLSLSDIAINARAVISPSEAFSQPFFNDADFVPLSIGDLSRDVYIVSQSSKKAFFSIELGEFSCVFYYDTASDKLIIRNQSATAIILAEIQDDNGIDENDTKVLDRRHQTIVSPGPWRVLSANHDRKVLGDFLLLKRCYVLEKTTQVSLPAGSKRKNESVSAAPSKRARDDHNVILFNPAVQDEPTSPTSVISVKNGNPLPELQPGQQLTIRLAASSTPEKDDSVHNKELVIAHSNIKEAENYSLRHMRDIAVNKGLASIFRGHHSVFGDTAVKVIRTRKVPDYLHIPTIARSWHNEEHLLRSVKHPSIIDFFGSDARLFSIYMEYLPYPDLADLRDQRSHYFSGTIEDATHVLRDMASALEYLANQKILHNDIKPSNILYEQSRGPVLIDFGLASIRGDPVCSGGTPWYVPPEYLEFNTRDIESDVFALGVTLLYLLKKTPIPERSHMTWAIAQVAKEEAAAAAMTKWLRKVAEMGNDLEESGFEGIVKRTLAPKRNSRISAQDIVKEFEG